MKKPKVIILEGGGDSNQMAKDAFDNNDIEWREFKDLFKHPHRLRTVADIDPDYIYIFTTGMMSGGREQGHTDLRAVFKSLNWIPRNVIFGSEESAFTYLDIAKELKKKGTKFYFLNSFGNAYKRKINWI